MKKAYWNEIIFPVFACYVSNTRAALSDFFHRLLNYIRYNFIIFLTVITFINTNFVRPAKAEDVLQTILDTLTSLTCETQGVGNLLRSEFTHTCIPAPFFTFLVANILSPGLYANTFLRVTINDKELFPGACSRANRIDFYDQKLSFGMCNNTMLATARIAAIAKTAVAIAKSIFTGKDPWDDIQASWELKKIDYHKMYIDQREGDEGTMIDIGLIPIFPWKVIKENDKMCVATQSFSGWIPIGCKYIKEPFPISIYSDFMDMSEEGRGDLERLTSLTTCANMGSCYHRAYNNSKAAIVMTGPIIECVKEMIAKLMVSNTVCNFEDVKVVLGSNARTSSSLFIFQQKMHLAVSAMLTLYVIFFGFKIVLAGDIPPKGEVVTFVVKFLFVIYFSVGININSSNEYDRMDGMIQWAFPFLLDGMNQMASWIINASPSQLCKFTDIEYPDTLRHLQLWDSLDCKVAHYLGLDAVQTLMVENASRNHDFSKLDILSFPIPPYIYLLIPAFLSGYMQLVSLALMYPLLVISVGAFIVNATVVCMISIVVLGVLAPLFVPMYLFEYTKGYFESWVKLLISFMLQPMVAVVFMTTMLSVYDYGFYGTCKYTYTDFTYSGPNVSIDIGVIGGSTMNLTDHRSARYFYVDQNWSGSYDSEEEIEGCRNSLGFMLNNPFQFLFDTGEDLGTAAAMPWLDDASGEEDKKRFDFLDSLTSTKGMFFNVIEVIYEKIKKLVLALLTACFTLYLMYHFSESLAEFAADMTEGVSVGNMAIKPQTIFKAGMKAASMLGGAKGGDKGGGGGGATDKVSTGGGRGGATDKLSTGGGGGATDKMSTGGGGASDKMSTGGGSGGKGASDKVMSGLNPQALASGLKSSATSGFDASKASSSSVKKTETEGSKESEDSAKKKPKSEKDEPEAEQGGGSMPGGSGGGS